MILLDEAPHLEQRKLMLPAFHGDKMQKLSGLMEELAEREVAGWPTGEPVELHPRFQALTLEIILRAVFGLEAGERLDALRERLTEMLEFGASPAVGEPAPSAELPRLRPVRAASLGHATRRTAWSTPRSTTAAAPASAATTCSPCCSTRATRTAPRCRARRSATS